MFKGLRGLSCLVLLLASFLFVDKSYGIAISADQAQTQGVPVVSGDGVFIEAYNSIGGGPAPTPAAISGRTPSGTTLSPFVDFPRPGNTINVGQSFNTFFQSTTTTPDQLAGVAARNFILKITTLLKVTSDLDRNVSTPAIDMQLRVGSDDGFYLIAGSTFIGSAGDRGFGWSSYNLEFESEGLYPITLLYAANSVGYSGLEFNWITALHNGLIPQEYMYLSEYQCSQQVVFDEKVSGTYLTDDYAGEGVIFNVISGDLRVTNELPTQFVPVSPANVFGDPTAFEAEAGEVELTFVLPGTSQQAYTDYFSFWVIDAEEEGAVVTAYDFGDNVIFSQEYHEGGASRTEVVIEEPVIARVNITLGSGSDTSAIDNLCFNLPQPIVAPEIADISDEVLEVGLGYVGQAPALTAGTEPVVWSLVNAPADMEIDPATGVVSWVGSEMPGVYVIEVQALNPAGTDTESWQIELMATPEIADMAAATARLGLAYAGEIPQVINGAPQVVWTLLSGPAEMTIDATTGQIYWSNPVKDGSPYEICLQGSNPVGSDSVCMQLTVLDLPVIVPVADISIAEHETYSCQPVLAGGLEPVTWSLVASPELMEIDDNTGAISWSDPQVGTGPYEVTIQAQNADGYSQESWQITVMTVPVLAEIASQQTVAGISTYFGPMPEVLAGSSPMSWTLLDGPDGMSVNISTGRVIWPQPVYSSEPYSITVELANAVGSDTVTWLLEVLEAPIIGEIENAVINEREVYVGPLPVLVSGGPAVSWQLLSGPAGMTIDSELGVVTWEEPIASGSDHPVVIRVTDDKGATDDETWLLSVPVSYNAVVYTDVDTTTGGSAVALYGQALDLMTAEPVAFVPVKIAASVKGFNRYVTALTDSEGNFAADMQLLGQEAGHYYLSADHPAGSGGVVTDEFVVYGMSVTPAVTAVHVLPDGSYVGEAELENLSDIAMTGLTYQVVSMPDNVSVDILLPAELGAASTEKIYYSVSVTGGDIAAPVLIDVQSQQGAVVRMTLDLTVPTDKAVLSVEPVSLNAGMVRGSQTLVSFVVSNTGGGDSGLISVLLPEVSWLKLASPATVTSLAAGESTEVVLQLLPDADLGLGNYAGYLLVQCSDSYAEVPFVFRAISSSTGSLMVTAVDEYTYYAQGAPKVEQALVNVVDPVSKETVVTGYTDSEGRITFADLTEGYYTVKVTAAEHDNYISTVYVKPGRTADVIAYLAYQTVKYVWSVTPVGIEDHYKIVIESTFKTDVPAPVVTVEPSVLDMSDLLQDGQSMQVDLNFTNHGLISAYDLSLYFADNPEITIDPLVDTLEEIPAKTTITIPVMITRHPAVQPAAEGGIAAASTPARICHIPAYTVYSWECYGTKWRKVELYTVPPRDFECPAPSGPSVGYAVGSGCINCGGWSGTGGTGGGSGGRMPCIFSVPIDVSSPVDCEGCETSYSFSIGYSGGFLKAIAERVAKAALKLVPYFDVDDFDFAVSVGLELERCCKDGVPTGEWKKEITLGGDFSVNSFVGPNGEVDLGTVEVPGLGEAGITLEAGLGGDITLSGGLSGTASKECEKDWRYCAAAKLGVDIFIGAIGEAKVVVGSDEVSGEVKAGISSGGNVQAELCNDTGLVVKGCVEDLALEAGVEFTYNDTSFSAGASKVIAEGSCTDDPLAASAADWFNGGIIAAADNEPEVPDFIITAEELAGSLGYSSVEKMEKALGVSLPYDEVSDAVLDRVLELYTALDAKQGICATVRLRIEQEVVMTREAFDACLELINDTDRPLEAIDVDIEVRNSQRVVVTDAFGIYPPVVTNMGMPDGTGGLGAQSSGQANWKIVPSTSVVTTAEPEEFFVSGTITYLDEGRVVVVPLSAASIMVYPQPELSLSYFHQKDVYSDDPWTDDVIEPAVPYELAVMVRNSGYGKAVDLKITSAQPQIIENEKGLLIDFRIIGTEIDGQSVQPSLAVNLGDIDPNTSKIGRWLFTSSLQGEFIDYSATFEHVDGFGDERLSIIKSVEIHELIHSVYAQGVYDDGMSDFLVNDIPDVINRPDRLYLSDGRIEPVAAVLNAEYDAIVTPTDLQVVVTVPAMGQGWTYLRLEDPGYNDYQLAAVQRADGEYLRVGDNAWLTHKVIRNLSQQPYEDNYLHIFDYGYGQSETYIITYTNGDVTVPQVNAIVADDIANQIYGPYSFSVTYTDNVG
ncbi:MAG: hypothetical protein JW745_03325, partial [Sedimentisphaerales bacterium]|nr:hypothetical protein [Sedimentisphaerales bacterium]